ncbi:MAG: hypothetical protein JSU65_13810 [Candidatus Zixiibacteriota bacterium]|nr:MAG: hypothetical protein JSU65_13810 [candidate division Zixibacteria bacterium]
MLDKQPAQTYTKMGGAVEEQHKTDHYMSNRFLAWLPVILMIVSMVSAREPVTSGIEHKPDPPYHVLTLGRQSGTASLSSDPAWEWTVHNQGNIQVTVSNFGYLGGRYYDFPIIDPLTGDPIQAVTYPKYSDLVYSLRASLAIGGVVDGDTSVTWMEFNPDMAPFGRFTMQSIDVTRPYYSDEAHSELDLVCEYYDTLRDLGGVGQWHRPLGLRVTQRSMAWSGTKLGEFVLVHFIVEAMGSLAVKDMFAGLEYGGLVAHNDNFTEPQDRVCGSTSGFLWSWPADSDCPSYDRVEVGYIMANNGQPLDGQFDHKSPLGAVGIRVLATPTDTCILNYDWWNYSESLGRSWHPQRRPQPGERLYDLSSHIYSLPMDKILYYVMSHREFDYDVMTTAVDKTAQGWMPPPPAPDAAILATFGGNPRNVLAFGPMDLGPGLTAQFTIAIVAGDSVHHNPTAHEQLWDPYRPMRFYDQLDFSDLAENANWAKWVYDNPGYDTDGDGYAGEFRVCNGDTTWYEGDGIPDFRADVPPPAPLVRVIPTTGKLTIRWNGYFSETNIDPFTRIKDFEGYRVYAGLDSRKSSMTLLSSFDHHNYNRFTYRQLTEERGEWRCRELPFTLESLRLIYHDPDFDPLAYTRSDPLVYNDTFYYFTEQDFNQFDLTNPAEIHKVYPDATDPGTDTTQWTEDDLTYEHGQPLPKYYEYEYVYDNLVATIPYFVAVTAFDFGFAKGGIPAKESNILNAQIESYAQVSSDSVEYHDLEAYVYPNPWRADADYRERGLENRDKTQIPARSQRIHFANLPHKCKISIFTLDGDLVRELDHDYPPDSPEAMHDEWDMITRNAMLCVSGMYYYVIESDDRTQVGTFVIIM